MTLTRWTSAAAAAALLVTAVLVSTASAAPDPTYPTGTFALDRTSNYLQITGSEVIPDFADFSLTRTALADDTTPAADIVVKVLRYGAASGPSDHPVIWANTTGPYQLEYNTTGTFHPQVWLTDADHNTTVVDLPTITVLTDKAPPVTTMVAPRPVNRLASWRVLHGTIADAGVGVEWVNLQILQKRRGHWYFYDLDTKHWTKGKATLAATRKNFHSISITDAFAKNGPWRTAPIVGLTKSPTAVCFAGWDLNNNHTTAKCVSGRITRR